MTGWSIPLESLAAKVNLDLETVARVSTLDVFRAVGLRSPVGNAELWAANADAVAFNKAAEEFNLALRSDPKNLTKNGRLKRGLKKNERMELRAGEGYVGGRFRANWNVSYGVPDEAVTDSIDKERVLTEAQKAMSLPIGGVMYMTNALPYANRLEYEGWSSQAPAGMVRLAALEFSAYVQKAIK